jgi:hypothetical protein
MKDEICCAHGTHGKEQQYNQSFGGKPEVRIPFVK